MHTQLHDTQLVKSAFDHLCFCLGNGTQNREVAPQEGPLVWRGGGVGVVAGGKLHEMVLQVEIDSAFVHYKWVAWGVGRG